MSKQELLQIIEKKRAELIDIVLKNGLNSTISLKYSQELDKLLTQYIRDDHNSSKTKNKQACS
ncbi:aspartyl-phosphate phosphatase Spo0E family protein [Metabacillus litoralis]|uniref:Aspartyl-phosphate phosphatase Spo0E family protein n=1 Tax=Metabacillus litoralis TaxID=152268 RepID=A0A5C6W7K2_9BACI|nr:aspartyl-phosphate phosphatase Spo0E family protein [Metabacillus litoralis]TXC91849.1 aspartyl-phosphate phosphatase Spo0E family protein [Metabacillus litoralis]